MPGIEDYNVLAERFGPMIVDLRSRRKPTEENWLLFYAAWRAKNTRSFFRSEIFQHYLPAARRSVEKFVKRAAQMLIPSSDFFEVYPASSESQSPGQDLDARAEAVQAYLSYVWRKRIKVYPLVRKMLRHYALYGRAIAKCGVEVTTVPRLVPRGRKLVEDLDVQVWPTVRVVDPFMFYVFPETESDVDKAVMIVEDNMMPFDTYQKYVTTKAMGVQSIEQGDLTAPVWPDHQVRRLQQQAMPEPTALSSVQDEADKRKNEVVQFVSLSEVWYREEGRWKMCWLAWNVKSPGSTTPRCVRISNDSPPRHPYRVAIDREITGEQYSTGMMDDLEPIQILVNDQLNMTMEGQATQFSPPAVIDPDLVSRPQSLVFRPRAKWFMKPEGVKWLTPADTTDAGFRGIQFSMGLMDDYSGAGSLADGRPQRNMPRAGFAVSSLMSLSLSDTKDAAQIIEDCVLTPLLGDTYRLTALLVPEDQIIRIPGANGVKPRRLSVSDLYGDFEFQWVGSMQSQDYQVRAQRLVGVLGIIARLAPNIGSQLQAEGKMMDWEYLFRRVWREGLGERGAGSFIRRMTQEELQFTQQMLMMQAQAASKPPVKVNLRGDIDPVTAKALTQEPTPVELETLHQAGQRGSAAPPGGSVVGPGGPASGVEAQASDALGRGMSSV